MRCLKSIQTSLLISIAAIAMAGYCMPVIATETSSDSVVVTDSFESAEQQAGHESDSSAPEWNLSLLMQSLAAKPASRVGFVETRHSDLLEQPLQITGELEYRPPATLIRRIVSPRPETFIIEDRHVTIERPRQNDRYLPLSAAPALEGLAQALRGVLGGNQAMLEEVFTLQLGGNAVDWQLQLTPDDADVSEEIAQLTIHGTDSELHSFEMVEPDGDRAVVVLQVLVDAEG